MLPDGDMWGDGFRWSTAAQFYHVWSGQKSLVYVIPKQWGRAQLQFLLSKLSAFDAHRAVKTKFINSSSRHRPWKVE